MGLFRAVLLAASLGCSAIVAIPQEAPGSGGHFSVETAHTESVQPTLLTPTTQPSPDKPKSHHTLTYASPIIETPQSHLLVDSHGATPHFNAPTTEHKETHLEVPSQVSTHGNSPDTPPRSTSNIGGDPTDAQPHQEAPGSGEAAYTPGVTTLYAAGTPVVIGPAGTAVFIHGTPVAAGLPAAVIEGTTYALQPGASTLWVNGRPERLPNPTHALPPPDTPPNAPQPTHDHPETASPSQPTQAHPETTSKVENPTPSTKALLDHPTDQPSPASATSYTWTGPGLAGETGVSNAAVQLLPGISLAIFCLWVTLM